MQRNEEGLSTRDLASPSDRAADTVSTPELEPRGRVSSGGAAPATAASAPAGMVSAEPPAADTAQPREEETETMRPPSGDTSPGSDDLAGQASTPVDAPQGEDAPPLASSPGTSTAATTPDSNEPLVPTELSETFQERWEEIQTRFVDEPRGAVEDADGLVAKLMQQLAEGFANERERLEAHWGRGEDISTEDLRVALQRYRSFFQRLLST